IETTALGSAFLAGLGVGIWKNLKELEKARETDRLFKPAMKQAERDRLYSGWRRAVERASRWEQPDC
nr:glycerol kinase [bacterium]